MKTLTERLNFATSSKFAPAFAVQIDARKEINAYETICKFVADNGIEVSRCEFDAAESCFSDIFFVIVEEHDSFYFWID